MSINPRDPFPKLTPDEENAFQALTEQDLTKLSPQDRQIAQAARAKKSTKTGSQPTETQKTSTSPSSALAGHAVSKGLFQRFTDAIESLVIKAQNAINTWVSVKPPAIAKPSSPPTPGPAAESAAIVSRAASLAAPPTTLLQFWVKEAVDVASRAATKIKTSDPKQYEQLCNLIQLAKSYSNQISQQEKLTPLVTTKATHDAPFEKLAAALKNIYDLTKCDPKTAAHPPSFRKDALLVANRPITDYSAIPAHELGKALQKEIEQMVLAKHPITYNAPKKESTESRELRDVLSMPGFSLPAFDTEWEFFKQKATSEGGIQCQEQLAVLQSPDFNASAAQDILDQITNETELLIASMPKRSPEKAALQNQLTSFNTLRTSPSPDNTKISLAAHRVLVRNTKWITNQALIENLVKPGNDNLARDGMALLEPLCNKIVELSQAAVANVPGSHEQLAQFSSKFANLVGRLRDFCPSSLERCMAPLNDLRQNWKQFSENFIGESTYIKQYVRRDPAFDAEKLEAKEDLYDEKIIDPTAFIPAYYQDFSGFSNSKKNTDAAILKARNVTERTQESLERSKEFYEQELVTARAQGTGTDHHVHDIQKSLQDIEARLTSLSHTQNQIEITQWKLKNHFKKVTKEAKKNDRQEMKKIDKFIFIDLFKELEENMIKLTNLNKNAVATPLLTTQASTPHTVISGPAAETESPIIKSERDSSGRPEAVATEFPTSPTAGGMEVFQQKAPLPRAVPGALSGETPSLARPASLSFPSREEEPLARYEFTPPPPPLKKQGTQGTLDSATSALLSSPHEPKSTPEPAISRNIPLAQPKPQKEGLAEEAFEYFQGEEAQSLLQTPSERSSTSAISPPISGSAPPPPLSQVIAMQKGTITPPSTPASPSIPFQGPSGSIFTPQPTLRYTLAREGQAMTDAATAFFTPYKIQGKFSGEHFNEVQNRLLNASKTLSELRFGDENISRGIETANNMLKLITKQFEDSFVTGEATPAEVAAAAQFFPTALAATNELIKNTLEASEKADQREKLVDAAISEAQQTIAKAEHTAYKAFESTVTERSSPPQPPVISPPSIKTKSTKVAPQTTTTAKKAALKAKSAPLPAPNNTLLGQIQKGTILRKTGTPKPTTPGGKAETPMGKIFTAIKPLPGPQQKETPEEQQGSVQREEDTWDTF